MNIDIMDLLDLDTCLQDLIISMRGYIISMKMLNNLNMVIWNSRE